MAVLKYKEWRKFDKVIKKAMEACAGSNYYTLDHFVFKDKMINIAKDAKLKRDNVDNEYTANFVHYEVGREVRNSIKRLGGTMPEDLPMPEKSLKELEKEEAINNKKLYNRDIN